jgi:hypothetical protein
MPSESVRCSAHCRRCVVAGVGNRLADLDSARDAIGMPEVSEPSAEDLKPFFGGWSPYGPDAIWWLNNGHSRSYVAEIEATDKDGFEGRLTNAGESDYELIQFDRLRSYSADIP